MVKVYFHDNLDGDQRLPHEGAPATIADLADLGVFATNIVEQSEVDRIAKERGYKNRDEVLSRWKQLSFSGWISPQLAFPPATVTGRRLVPWAVYLDGE